MTTEDAWLWSHAFVGIGIAAVVVALSIALFNNVPSLKAMLEAATAGDMAVVAASAKKVTTGGAMIALILVGTEIAMVLRLGAGLI